MLRHIAWFNEATIEPDASGELASPDVHVRERCLIPARELEKMGIACSVFGNLHDADPTHVAQHLQKLSTDIVVISNIDGLALFAQARMAKHLGCYVIADFGAAKPDSETKAKFLGLVDQIIVADESLATLFHQDHCPVEVIPNCDDDAAAASVASLWLHCFKRLKTKPPACANSNQPKDA